MPREPVHAPLSSLLSQFSPCLRHLHDQSMPPLAPGKPCRAARLATLATTTPASVVAQPSCVGAHPLLQLSAKHRNVFAMPRPASAQHRQLPPSRQCRAQAEMNDIKFTGMESRNEEHITDGPTFRAMRLSPEGCRQYIISSLNIVNVCMAHRRVRSAWTM